MLLDPRIVEEAILAHFVLQILALVLIVIVALFSYIRAQKFAASQSKSGSYLLTVPLFIRFSTKDPTVFLAVVCMILLSAIALKPRNLETVERSDSVCPSEAKQSIQYLTGSDRLPGEIALRLLNHMQKSTTEPTAGDYEEFGRNFAAIIRASPAIAEGFRGVAARNAIPSSALKLWCDVERGGVPQSGLTASERHTIDSVRKALSGELK